MFRLQISEQAGENLLSALRRLEASTFSNMKRMCIIRIPTNSFILIECFTKRKKRIFRDYPIRVQIITNNI
jgi:hypothetical protein